MKKSIKKYSLTVLLAGLLVLTAFNVMSAPVSECTTGVVTSKAGSVCGKRVATSSGNQAQAFLGIPFAESTAGEKRWTAPVPRKKWHKTRAALQYGPMCPQKISLPVTQLKAAPHYNKWHSLKTKGFKKGLKKQTRQSEDCLSLNIWTPVGATPDEKLPVMVFIYGGGFVAGDSSDPLYDGAYLAANKGVILVSFNYRLGVLGFLATDELSGNYGFMDQQLALSWVQANIDSFGGDPEKVTLFGESAGAMSVGLHLFSAPGSTDLFRAAIMESNFLALPYKQLKDQVNVGNMFMQGLNCRDLACLKKTSVNTLLQAQDAFTLPMSTVFSGAKYYLPYTPAIDGELLTRQPTVAASEGEQDKPILIGTNKNEAVLFVGGRAISPADYSAWAASLFGLDFQKVIAKYPAKSDSNNSALWARVQTDNFLLCSSRYIATHAKASVYTYLFDHQPSFKVWGGAECQTDNNVCHGAELPFVFHTANKIGGKFTQQEEALSESIMNYWTDFAKTLNPNGNLAATQPQWPKFAGDKKNYLALNVPASTVQNDPYRGTCEFWDGVGYNLVEPWLARW